MSDQEHQEVCPRCKAHETLERIHPGRDTGAQAIAWSLLDLADAVRSLRPVDDVRVEETSPVGWPTP